MSENPYESGNEPSDAPSQKFRPGRVIIAATIAAVLLGSSYAFYELGYSHGYQDGADDRVSVYSVNQKRR